MRTVIGVDIDDTKANTMTSFLGWYNRNHGTSIKKDDIWNYALRHVFNISDEQERQMIGEFFVSPDARRMQPNVGSQVACLRLGQEYDVVSITSRTIGMEALTRRWIAEHYSSTFSSIHVTNGYSATGPKRKKTDVCRDLDARVMIDDSPDVAREFSDAGIPMILIDQPWNQGLDYKGVYRVGNWRKEDWWMNGIVEKVKELVG